MNFNSSFALNMKRSLNNRNFENQTKNVPAAFRKLAVVPASATHTLTGFNAV